MGNKKEFCPLLKCPPPAETRQGKGPLLPLCWLQLPKPTVFYNPRPAARSPRYSAPTKPRLSLVNSILQS